MALALDHELADFFNFLGHQVGLANVWIALSADHGVSALARCGEEAAHPRRQSGCGQTRSANQQHVVCEVFSRPPAAYIKLDYPVAWLDQDAFAAAHLKERDAESAAGEAMKQAGLRDYFTKSQLAEGEVPAHRSRQKVLEQLLTRRRLVCHGRPGVLTPSARREAPTTPRPTLTTRTCPWLSTDCRFGRARIAPTPSRSISQPRSRRCSASTLLLTPWGAYSPRRLPRHIRPRMLRDLRTPRTNEGAPR
jgi:hypothetical protein